jgi:hypothetical protein
LFGGLSAGGLAAVGFAVVRLVFCIEEVVGVVVVVVSIEQVVVFAVVPPNLWLIKKVSAEWASQSPCQEVAN